MKEDMMLIYLLVVMVLVHVVKYIYQVGEVRMEKDSASMRNLLVTITYKLYPMMIIQKKK